MTAVSMPSPYRQRVERLRTVLNDRGLDALVLIDPPNVRYLSGFQSTFAWVVVDATRATLVTDGRYIEAAEKQLVGWECTCTAREGLDGWWKQFWRRRHYRTLGFEGTAPWGQVQEWSRLARPAKLKETTDEVLNLRRVKDTSEIAVLRKAAHLADQVMERAIAFLRPGVSEIEVSRFIRRMADEVGAEGESFPNIVASGSNSSRPHHHPGTRHLRIGDMVILDLGVIWRGYCSDITRTVALGSCSRRMREVYEACLRAQTTALGAVRPGLATKEADAIARRSLAQAGLSEHFKHGLGHGVGLEIHEGPTLNSRSDEVLAEGMAITIEPGVYLSGAFGVRIEDLAIVGPRGPRVLSRTPKDLRIV